MTSYTNARPGAGLLVADRDLGTASELLASPVPHLANQHLRTPSGRSQTGIVAIRIDRCENERDRPAEAGKGTPAETIPDRGESIPRC